MDRDELNREIARLERIVNSDAGRTTRERAQDDLAPLYFQRDMQR